MSRSDGNFEFIRVVIEFLTILILFIVVFIEVRFCFSFRSEFSVGVFL